jgi:hypothetical protein
VCHRTGGESHRLVVDARKATVGEGRGICVGGGVRLYWVDVDGIVLNWGNPNCGPVDIIAMFCSSCWYCATGAKRPYCGKGIPGFGKCTLAGQTSSLSLSPCYTLGVGHGDCSVVALLGIGGEGASSNVESLRDKSLQVPALLLPPLSAALSNLIRYASLLSMAIQPFFFALLAACCSLSKVLCSLSMAFCSFSKAFLYFDSSLSIHFLSFSLAAPSLCTCKYSTMAK